MTTEARPPRNILFVHSSDEMYGADLVLFHIVSGLDPRRFRPLVLLPNDVPQAGALSRRLAESGIRVQHLPLAVLRRKFFTPWGFAGFLVRLCRSTAAVARLVRREAIDIVHSNTSAVIPGALAARLTRRPHVWQTLEIILKPRLLWRFLSWLLPVLSRRVVAASGPTREHLCAGNRRNLGKSVVFHNGVYADRIARGAGTGRAVREELGIPAPAPLVGLVGRINRWKGQAWFLDVASRVAREHPDARFLICGSPFHGQEQLVDEIRALIGELKLGDRVAMTGYREDVPAVLDALDVLVLPSTMPDPFPTTVLEAMAAAKPVVANAHGGCIEMIVHGATGLLVDPSDPQAMAAAVGRLLADPAERRRMGEAGRERVRERFTVEAFVSRWMQLYDEVLDESGARAAEAPSTPRERALAALERASAEEARAEKEFAQAFQFAVGNGGRQGDAGRRAASRALERARARRRKAEQQVRRLSAGEVRAADERVGGAVRSGERAL